MKDGQNTFFLVCLWCTITVIVVFYFTNICNNVYYSKKLASAEHAIREGADTVAKTEATIELQSDTIGVLNRQNQELKQQVADLNSKPDPDKDIIQHLRTANANLRLRLSHAMNGIDHLQCALQDAQSGTKHLCDED